ncbi:hypothetical protein [Coleofasciculus sp. E1-EBD-02]|uniref:hypothetical protein n=1 Tax=Coleofasciculus sp. E1-EBD-02 TaxID=3068481 RepID=UPI0032F61720
MLKLKSLGLSIIAASVVLGSQALASVPASVLDQHTDSYFWTVHPEMWDKAIQPHQTQYKKEVREVQYLPSDQVVALLMRSHKSRYSLHGYF